MVSRGCGKASAGKELLGSEWLRGSKIKGLVLLSKQCGTRVQALFLALQGLSQNNPLFVQSQEASKEGSPGGRQHPQQAAKATNGAPRGDGFVDIPLHSPDAALPARAPNGVGVRPGKLPLFPMSLLSQLRLIESSHCEGQPVCFWAEHCRQHG